MFTPQLSGHRTFHDDHQRHLLGLLGQYLQGRQELSLRTVLLGLCHRHLSDLADPRPHHGSTSNDASSLSNNVHSADHEQHDLRHDRRRHLQSRQPAAGGRNRHGWPRHRLSRSPSESRSSSASLPATRIIPRRRAAACARRRLRRSSPLCSTAKPMAAWPSPGAPCRRKSIVVCIVSGVLMGLWAPFMTRPCRMKSTATHARSLRGGRVSYLGALLSCFIWNIYFMKHPLVGEPVSFAGFFHASRIRPCARPARRIHLGHRHGLQSGRRPLHRSRHLLRHRPIRAHGRRALGSLRLERICGRARQSQDLLVVDVCLLLSGNLLVAKANG